MFSWLPSFQQRYFQHVIYEHRIFNVRGLRTMGTFTLELETVFVELKIAPSSNPQQANFNPLSNRELAGNRPIWDFLKNSQQSPLFAIIGAPGSGKTTLLQHLALSLAKQRQRPTPLTQRYLPIFLFLRNHVRTIVDDYPPLASLAQQHFSDERKYPDLKPPRDWFARQLKKQPCMILLDGLDEVAELSERQQVAAWIEQQVLSYPRCQFIVTARPQGYLSAPLHRAHVLEVQPFNLSQVRQFIHSWYLANEVVSFGHKVDDGIRWRAKQGADDLLMRLNAMQTLSALTVNPLLLTMIAMVHRYRGQLPGRRVELYAEICDVLLGHWRQAIGVQDSLTAAQKRVVLQPLAAQMMLLKVRDIATTQAAALIADPMEAVGLEGRDAVQFLNDVQASSGLLLEQAPNFWSFAHLTFQEYLTAAHLLEQKTPLSWVSLVNDSWWHETLLLYAAQGDATPLVQACLQQGTVPALTLAADCMEEARELDRTVREQVSTRLSLAIESEEPERRRLAAEVRLNQRLKNLQRLDESRDIDLHSITWAEYQLFLDEYYAQGRYCQPDHWQGYQFQAGHAQLPVAGIRAEDAEAFCYWLSEREGGKLRYRLPTPEEALSSLPMQPDLATWCKQGEHYRLVFHAVETEQSALFAVEQAVARAAPHVLPMPVSLNDFFKTWCFTSLAAENDWATRHQTRIRALDCMLAFDFDHALAHAFNFAHDIDLELAHNRAFEFIHAYEMRQQTPPASLSQDSVLIRDLARDMVMALDLARDIISALELARDISLAQPIDNRALSRSLVRARDLSHGLEQLSQQPNFSEMSQARDMARSIARDLSNDLARARARDLATARVRDLTQARAKALDRARTLAFSLTRALVFISEFEPIYQQIEQNISEAQQRVVMMHSTDDVYLQRLASLVQTLLHYIQTPKAQKRAAWQQYLAQLNALLWQGYQCLEQAQQKQQKWWLFNATQRPTVANDQQVLADSYWWMQMVIARQQGRLPCWETLRVVREGLVL